MVKITDVRANPGDSAFLIESESSAILYDSGFAFTGEKVCNNIKKVLNDKPLDYIFLTHSHYDHALGSCYVLRRYPDAKVVAGEYCEKIFAKPSARALMRELDQKFAKTCNVFQYEDLIDSLRVDITVSDGDRIKAGDLDLMCISLPGHTKCSFGFYLEREKLLLSSETLGVYDGDKNIIPSFLVGYKMTLDSIDKAKNLDIEGLLIPHYGLIQGDRARFYLENAKKTAVDTCRSVASVLKFGGTKEDAFDFFKKRFYHGRVTEAYPYDAFALNTSIMIDLIAKEIL